MRTAKPAALAATAFLAAILASFPATAEDCSLKRVALLDVTGDSGAMTIPMTIAGKEALMVVNTASSQSWLSQTFASSVPGSRGRTTSNYGFYFKTEAGDVLSEVIKVKSIKIGELESNNAVHFMIDPDTSSGDPSEVTIDGVLGNNILMSFDLELDPAGKKVGFYLHHECAEKAPVHWAREWAEIPIKKNESCNNKDRRECYVSPTTAFEHIIVDVTIDGKTVPAFLDTSSEVSVLDTATATQILGRKPSEGETANEQSIGVSGESVKTIRAGFKNLSFSGITVHNPQLDIADIYNPRAKMVIGMDKLRSLHLYFAFKQRKIYATPAQ
jgi:hypothetical protein